jgi:hypothetical protein
MHDKVTRRVIGTCRRIVLAAAHFVISSCLCAAQTNVLTYHNDNFHTGQNQTERILTLANVNPWEFGELRRLSTDGNVEGQPLYVAGVVMSNQEQHNVVFAATEHDSVYAWDADTGATLWQVSLLLQNETPSDSRGCAQVIPEIGVTATPVIDLSVGDHGTMYLVSMSKSSDGRYFQRLHALDITSGQEEFAGPVEITAAFPGSGDGSSGGMVAFDPKMYKERAALVLSRGVLYTSWSSHCDFPPYTGWVVGYDPYSLSQVFVYNFTPNGEGGTIWGGGAGAAVDEAGNLFFQLANGTFEPNVDSFGFPLGRDYGNSFVKLSTSGIPSVLDYWTMHNTNDESDADIDLGSGGVMLLPDVTDTNGTIKHLGVGAGKNGNVYVFDRDNMGKFDPNSDSTIYQELPGALAGGEFAAPAWFNNTVYFGAVGDQIRAFTNLNGRFSAAPSAATPTTFGYPGTTPVISSNGTLDGILWATENTDPIVLHAYDAMNIATELYSSQSQNESSCGAGVKWTPPAVADGKVFVPTTTGVCVFGILPRSCLRIVRPLCPRLWHACGCEGIIELFLRHGPPSR